MRLPSTIWKYTLLELTRLVLLTAALLVTVIVFAAAVRYTAAGKLSALDTLKFMAMAAVPMLQYALPFAAGFGATLVYHRMASDNELKAAAASGVSHRALLMPALGAGVVLTAVLGLLSTQVIPGFLRSMQRMVTQDMTRMIVTTIRGGQSIDLEGLMVHADTVREMGPDEGRQFSQRLLLTGVAAIGVDNDGKVDREATAQQAVVGFAPAAAPAGFQGESLSSGGTQVTLVLKNFIAWDRENGTSLSAEQSKPMTWTVPGVFDDDPKFLTSGELAALPKNPDRLNIINSRREAVAYRIADRRAMSELDATLRRDRSASLVDSAGTRYTIRAGGLRWRDKPEGGPEGAPEGAHDGTPDVGHKGGKDTGPALPRWELTPAGPSRSVEVEIAPVNGAARRFAARSGGLRSDPEGDGADTRSFRLTLDLEEFRGADEGSGVAAAKRYSGLVPAHSPLPELLRQPSAALISLVRSDPGLRKDTYISGPTDQLEQRIKRLKREVISKQHERAAMSISCLVMVIAGALSAMRLAGSLPLTVYLWSFFPALIAVITISAGQQAAHQSGLWGLALLWSGVGLLVAYVGVAFWSVRRH
jgi:lipopolysaccharide export LptBFGC system permease protein LptF